MTHTVEIPLGSWVGPGAATTYRHIRHQRLTELLGLWASELEPQIFERIDVSPQILTEVGIGAPGDRTPLFVRQVMANDVATAMGMPF